MYDNNLIELQMFTNVRKLEKGHISPSDFITELRKILKLVIGRHLTMIKKITLNDTELKIELVNGNLIEVEVSTDLKFLHVIYKELREYNLLNIKHNKGNYIINNLDLDINEFTVDELENLNNILNELIKVYTISPTNLVLVLISQFKNKEYNHLKSNYEILKYISNLDLIQLCDIVESSFLNYLLKKKPNNLYKITYWLISDLVMNIKLEYTFKHNNIEYNLECNYLVDVLSKDTVDVKFSTDKLILSSDDIKVYFHNTKESNKLLSILKDSISPSHFYNDYSEFNELQHSIIKELGNYLTNLDKELLLMNVYINSVHNLSKNGFLCPHVNLFKFIHIVNDDGKITYYLSPSGDLNKSKNQIIKVDCLSNDEYLITLISDDTSISIKYHELNRTIDALIFFTKTITRIVNIQMVINLLEELLTLPSFSNYIKSGNYCDIPLSNNIIPINDEISLLTNINNNSSDNSLKIMIKDSNTNQIIFSKNISILYYKELTELIRNM